MAAVMDTVMVMVMGIRWAIITMARRLDGRAGARSAGAVTAVRPACGSRAAADAQYLPMMQGAAPHRAAPSHMPRRSRTRPAITAVVTPTGQNACIGIGLMPVMGMSISAFGPPISRRAS